MKNIYIEDANKNDANEKAANKNIEYFICAVTEGKEKEIISFSGIKAISEKAFRNANGKIIKLDKDTEIIGQSAFENCTELELLFFGEMRQNGDKDACCGHTIKGLSKCEADTFEIQTEAFKNCSKLTTVILPEIKSKLFIEKDAFSGCEDLRTVVLITDEKCEVDFTENPFTDCPKHLTFVCKKDSKIARFARENGYRGVYVE